VYQPGASWFIYIYDLHQTQRGGAAQPVASRVLQVRPVPIFLLVTIKLLA